MFFLYKASILNLMSNCFFQKINLIKPTDNLSEKIIDLLSDLVKLIIFKKIVCLCEWSFLHHDLPYNGKILL